jgi:hypothetical protein
MDPKVLYIYWTVSFATACVIFMISLMAIILLDLLNVVAVRDKTARTFLYITFGGGILAISLGFASGLLSFPDVAAKKTETILTQKTDKAVKEALSKPFATIMFLDDKQRINAAEVQSKISPIVNVRGVANTAEIADLKDKIQVRFFHRQDEESAKKVAFAIQPDIVPDYFGEKYPNAPVGQIDIYLQKPK